MEDELNNFLANKSDTSIELFHHFATSFKRIGDLEIKTTKSMIVFKRRNGFAYVIQIGKKFIDVVLPFNEPHENNLCFRKIKQVPGTSQFNHHLRIYFKEDINDEVVSFMNLAYKNSL